jgi:hypothetical protein
METSVPKGKSEIVITPYSVGKLIEWKLARVACVVSSCARAASKTSLLCRETN